MVNLSVNSPIPTDVASECRKCADIIDHFVKPEKAKSIDQLIPPHILANAKGVAIITILKAGFLFSGRGGGGLVVAKLPNGEWSAPSAIGSAGIGFGGQIGAEITDFVIILNTDAAVHAFSSGGNVTLGGSLSVAAGPYGRTAEASGTTNLAAVYSYSKSKGLFAGISIEGTAIIERKETNAAFYNQRISAREILSGKVGRPAAAEVLYRALDRRIIAAAQMKPKYGPGTSKSEYGSDASSSGASAYPGAAPVAGPSGMAGNPVNPHPSLNAQGVASLANAQYQQQQYSQQQQPPPYSSSSMSRGNDMSKQHMQPVSMYPGSMSAGSQSNSILSNATTSTGRRIPPPPPPRPHQSAGASTVTAVAMFDFQGQCDTDLSLRAGDIVTVLKQTENADGWWHGELNGRKGDFPGNYVKLQ